MTNVRGMTHSAGNATIATLYSEQVIPFLLQASWLLTLPLIIVLTDCWFGIRESKQQGKTIRFSGAGWKTLRKLLDYYTLLSLGFVIAHILPSAIHLTIQEICFYSILLPSFFDLCSIVGHILNIKGIKKPYVNGVKFLVLLVKKKNLDIGEALEESLEDKKQQTKTIEKDVPE